MEGLRDRIRDQRPGRAIGGAFFGRDDDVAAIVQLLEEGNRLITITGPPGVGKTTLALHVLARTTSSDRPAVFVDLSDARSGDEIALGVARAVDLASDERGTLDMPFVARMLASAGPLVLVLDNLEQLATRASSLEILLLGAPEVSVLATSRERLRLGSELVHALEPLSVPGPSERDRSVIEAADAVRLFVDRRARAGVRGEMSDDEIVAMRDIVRELDGWPLAIELAAARLSVMTARMLLERLGSRFALLSGGREERQGKLAVAIEWSLSLLDASALRALERATVFEGGFDLRAAEAVLLDPVEPPSRALDRVESLHDASLLFTRRDDRGEMRYAIYVSVAEYARLHASEATLLEAEIAHRDYFLDRARQWCAELRGPRAADALSSLERDEANLDAVVRRATIRRDTAALEMLAVLDPLRTLRGPLDRYAEQLDRALEAIDASPALRAAALGARGRARALVGEPEAAERDLREAVHIRETEGDPGIDEALRDLGVFLRARGAMEEGEGCLNRSIDLARQNGNRSSEARSLAEFGILRKERGDLTGAREGYESALAMFRALHDLRGEARVLCDLGALEQEEGAYSLAETAFSRALSIILPLGDMRLEAIARSDAGCLALETGSIDAAERSLRLAVERLDAIGDRRYAALFSGARAAALAGLGRTGEATGLFDAAEQALAQDRLFRGTVRVHRGHLDLAAAALARANGDATAALEATRRAENRLREATERAGSEESLAALSDDVRFAMRALEKALDRQREPTLVVGPGADWFVAGDAPRSDLTTRPVLRRLVSALVEAHAQGSALDAAALVRAGWPGERVASASAKNRLSVALNALREHGLRSVLERDDRGWYLSAAWRVVVADR
jgi:predicted ATPase